MLAFCNEYRIRVITELDIFRELFQRGGSSVAVTGQPDARAAGFVATGQTDCPPAFPFERFH
jgi:hypothetical protein